MFYLRHDCPKRLILKKSSDSISEFDPWTQWKPTHRSNSNRVKSHHVITWLTINQSMSTTGVPWIRHTPTSSNGPKTLVNYLHCSITIKSTKKQTNKKHLNYSGTELLRGCPRKNWPLEFRRITEFLEIFSVRWLVYSIGKNQFKQKSI